VAELQAALNALFAKVGDFFDIFDLSFFVAGAVCLGALAFGNSRGHFIEPSTLSDGYRAIMFLVACYVLGLVCFAAGRMLRPKRSSLFSADFKSVVERNGLGAIYGQYLTDRPGDAYFLYNRFWAVMRQTASLAPSFSLLRRYWSMSATYDGLVAALAVWWGVIVYWVLDPHATQPLLLRAVPLAVLPLALLLCRREAGRLTRFQMEELVASIACHFKTLENAGTPKPEATVVDFPRS
jgi:hypothetical protein